MPSAQLNTHTKKHKNIKIMSSTLPKITSIILASAALSFAAEGTEEKEVNSLVSNASIGEVIGNFSASISADYESEFIFRGKQLADAVVSPSVNLGYDFGHGFAAYLGWWGCFSTDDYQGSNYQEDDLFAGITYTIENFTIDFGYTLYTYASGGSTNENELKLCLSYDTSELMGDFAISPYVAGYYNFTYDGTVIEAGLSYAAPITKWLINENWATIDLAVAGGYADYNGGMADGGYAYLMASAGVSVAITDNWSISVGGRYSCNNDAEYTLDGRKSNFWLGASTSIGF